jgi:ATP-dependent Clp protease ATP-binding subunit ClpA
MAEQERDGSVDRISITLERAVQFANSLTHEYVTLEHLLFSIIEEEDVSKLFTDLEVDAGNIAKDVEKYLKERDDIIDE